jgi:hypothetical protein
MEKEWTIEGYKEGKEVSYLKERDQRNDPENNESATYKQN